MANRRVSRRAFLAGLAGGGAALGLGEFDGEAKASAGRRKDAVINSSGRKIYWGDIHNHNAVGYAKGSLERSYEIAKGHLDFFCFTGQSQWHDMPIMPENKHNKWVKGFEVFRNNWEKVQRLANENNKSGEFVSLIGYEWHSSRYGDVCVIFPGSQAELVYKDDIRQLQKFAAERGAILIPHHPSYKRGWRGQDWGVLDTSVSPVVEIFSEHGNGESDRGNGRYIRHSMGGRDTANTVERLLESGVKVGVVASSDDHLGYPGAYGEGLVAVHADGLSREAIIEAIRARRTYAVSADRIELDFRLNGGWMGEVVDFSRGRDINVKVKGKGIVESVEVVRNNEVIYRDHPVDGRVTGRSWSKPVLCRIEYGWGPWAALGMARVCDWKLEAMIDKGRIVSATPCFQSGPFDEDRRNRVAVHGGKRCEISSYTSRRQAFEEKATNSVILEIEGGPETELAVETALPSKIAIKKTLGELARNNEICFTGPFTSESVMVHRPVFAENYYTEFGFSDERTGKREDWYYVRVKQSNGSMAWSSPVWVGK